MPHSKAVPLTAFAALLPHNALRDQELHTFAPIDSETAVALGEQAREPRDGELLTSELMKQIEEKEESENK